MIGERLVMIYVFAIAIWVAAIVLAFCNTYMDRQGSENDPYPKRIYFNIRQYMLIHIIRNIIASILFASILTFVVYSIYGMSLWPLVAIFSGSIKVTIETIRFFALNKYRGSKIIIFENGKTKTEIYTNYFFHRKDRHKMIRVISSQLSNMTSRNRKELSFNGPVDITILESFNNQSTAKSKFSKSKDSIPNYFGYTSVL